jgi:transposase
MPGPGEYVPDVTEGISSVADLPKPRIERRSRNYPARRCSRCGHRAGRYSVASRTLHDLGDSRSGRPVNLFVTYSKHHCRHCDCYFAVDLSDLAAPKCQYTCRVQNLAVQLVAEDGLP